MGVNKYHLRNALSALTKISELLDIPYGSRIDGEYLVDRYTLYSNLPYAPRNVKRVATSIDKSFFYLISEINKEMKNLCEQDEKKELARLKQKYESSKPVQAKNVSFDIKV